MMSFPSLDGWMEVLLRLLAATAVGAIVGLNRELRDKPAGLRTHTLVAVGSALLTVTAIQLASAEGRVDGNTVARVIQGVVAGIGFIGGGVILQTGSNNVRGLTTASTIWVAAALGVACGTGQWPTAVIAAAITLVVLVGGGKAEQHLHRRLHGEDRAGDKHS